MNTPTTLADLLRESVKGFLKAYGITLKDLAARLQNHSGEENPGPETETHEEVSYDYLWKILNGKKPLKLDRLDQIARVLGVPTSMFFVLAERGRTRKWDGARATGIERGKFNRCHREVDSLLSVIGSRLDDLLGDDTAVDGTRRTEKPLEESQSKPGIGV
jgi:transcriptional regulator with XRE-family HTH domain